jgi:hypothetical protein
MYMIDSIQYQLDSFSSFCYSARYPTRYIDRHLQKFLIDNSIPSTSTMSTNHNEIEYSLLRRQILPLTTRSEHARANRIASQLDPTQIDSTTDPLIKAKLLRRQQKHK